MKTLRTITSILILATIVLWSFLSPRYSHPDNSVISNFGTALMPLIFIPISLIIASILGVIPFKGNPYKKKLEVLAYSLIIIFSSIATIVISVVLIGLNAS